VLTGSKSVTVRVVDRRDGGPETQTQDVVMPGPIVVVQFLPHATVEDAREERDGSGGSANEDEDGNEKDGADSGADEEASEASGLDASDSV